MPKPNVTKEDIDDPDDIPARVNRSFAAAGVHVQAGGPARAIQKGWWIVTKYNCIGCHQIGIGQKSVLMGLPQFPGGKQTESASVADE